MAYAITGAAQHPSADQTATVRATAADVSFTAGATVNTDFDLGGPKSNFKVAVYIKASYVEGTAGLSIKLIGADNSGFSTNPVVVGHSGVVTNATYANSDVMCFVVHGAVPTAGKQFLRVAVTTGTGESGTGDIAVLAS